MWASCTVHLEAWPNERAGSWPICSHEKQLVCTSGSIEGTQPSVQHHLDSRLRNMADSISRVLLSCCRFWYPLNMLAGLPDAPSVCSHSSCCAQAWKRTWTKGGLALLCTCWVHQCGSHCTTGRRSRHMKRGQAGGSRILIVTQSTLSQPAQLLMRLVHSILRMTATCESSSTNATRVIVLLTRGGRGGR